jgi:hypothetical protein
MMNFHIVDNLHGFSTTVETHAKGAQKFGAGYRTEQRKVATLATLVRRHGLVGIDFLKIDVEGAEADVLAGNDWREVRPRVVVIEAVAPGSMAEAHAAWEPILLANGYGFVFFDGLNRFYLAEEARHLAPRIPREKADWGAVRHLYEYARAPDNPDHPDHALARALIEGFLADLPRLPPDELTRLLGRSERFRKASAAGGDAVTELVLGSERLPEAVAEAGTSLAELLQTDQARAAIGRIAATYDGGQLLD